MDERDRLAEQFEKNRPHLEAVAYRMLGSLGEADDAVQEAWLRLGRAEAGTIANLSGWLTTVVARVCLDVLRSRKSRREESLSEQVSEPVSQNKTIDPEQEALLADSVGLALLVVLDTLPPAERLAFVLHDMFDLSFDEIAAIAGRSTAAARQLASRARRRVQGKAAAPNPDRARQREVVEAFLAASRGGDFDALLNLLDPNAALYADAAVPPGIPAELHGAEAIAQRAAAGRARAGRAALVDGTVGIVVAPRGHLFMVIRVTIADGKIVRLDAIAEPERLRSLDLGVLDA